MTPTPSPPTEPNKGDSPMVWKLLNRINMMLREPRTLDRFLYNCTPCPCGCNRKYDR